MKTAWNGLEPRWRGDLNRWKITSGTVFNILDNHEKTVSDPLEKGLFPTDLVAEVLRISTKYATVDDENVRMAAEHLITSTPVMMALLVALTQTNDHGNKPRSAVELGPLEYTPAGKVALTPYGSTELARIYSEFAGKVGSEYQKASVDMHEPLLEWEPPKGWGLEPSADFKLPPKRATRKHLTYRQWLTMLHKESRVYVAAQEEAVTRSPADTEAQKRKQEDDEKTRYRQIRPVRDFAKLVLSGGPESVWMGKPLIAKDVHNDCESFYAAGKPGFDRRIIEASSLAWELWETDNVSLSDYAEYKEWLEMRDIESRTLSDLRKRAEIDVDESKRPVAYKRMAGKRALERAEKSLIAYDPLGINGVMDHAGVAMADKVINPGNFGKLNPDGSVVHSRCSFVYGKGEQDPGYVTHTIKAGSQCGNIAVMGTTRCEMHGGLTASPEETRAMVLSSQLKLFALADQAVGTIADVMINGTTEAARLRAAETILNRAGIVEGAEVNVSDSRNNNGPAAGSARDIIMDRLNNLAGNPTTEEQRAAEQKAALEANTIEGEVVENPSAETA